MLVTLQRLRDGAQKCAEASLWPMSDTDLTVAVQQVHRLEQSIAAAKLHLVAEVQGRDLPGRQNLRDIATWLRSRLPATAAASAQPPMRIARYRPSEGLHMSRLASRTTLPVCAAPGHNLNGRS